MKRREFITLLGGAAAWPRMARAQERERMRRLGVLMSLTAEDPAATPRVAALLKGLQQLGWTDGRNVRIDIRWGAGDPERIRKYAAELVALAPDVILASGGTTLGPLRQVNRTVPVVFTAVTDPAGGGLVESLARPGGNMTGFAMIGFVTGAKWLELLKEIAPGVRRAAILRDTSPAGVGTFAAIQAVAPSLGLDASAVGAQDAGDIERAITAFTRSANGGLIVVPNNTTIVHRKLIIALAAKLHLPAVYGYRLFVTEGGLICYGPDIVDQCRRAASYADRILKGEQAANLPVQEPTKFELVINLKTAKALGLEVPPTLLARADEVIE